MFNPVEIATPYFCGDVYQVNIDTIDSKIEYISNKRNPIFNRARDVFNHEHFMYPAPPVKISSFYITPPAEDFFILRMCIKEIDSNIIHIPVEMAWLHKFIVKCISYEKANFPDLQNNYIYITVRSGPILQNDDDIFHVDGYQGLITARERPERNYLWVSSDPTLFAVQPFFISNLNPNVHNVHYYLNDNVVKENVFKSEANTIYLFDPYCVHARPKIEDCGKHRLMIRLSFIPQIIKDDMNTANPGIPLGPFNKEDPRYHLKSYSNLYEDFSIFGLKPQ